MHFLGRKILILNKNKIFFACCLFFFMCTTGIDMQYYPWDEHGITTFPSLFIKRAVSFHIIFEAPTPAEALRPSSLTKEESRKLTNYCRVRYGMALPECKKKLFDVAIAHGFYIPG